MKKCFALLFLLVLLTGCSAQNRELETGLQLRTRLLNAASCTFQTDITADYGDKQQRFSLQCEADSAGTIRFSVLKPDSIAGIEGLVDGVDGQLTFADTALFFPLLADDQVTPVSAPWLLMKTLRSGCITSAGSSGSQSLLSIDDSYADNALHLDIWLDSGLPVRSEILYRNRKILSLDVKDFRIQ